MMKRISAVTYYNAVNSFFNLLADSLSENHVLFRPHVLTEDAKQFFSVYVAYVGQLRHGAVQLTGRKSGNHSPGTVVKPRGNCTAGTQKLHIGFVIRIRERFLGNLVIGLIVTRLSHPGDGGNVNPDVITTLYLDHNMKIIIVLSPGQHCTTEEATGGLDIHLSPDSYIIRLEHPQGFALVSLKRIFRHLVRSETSRISVISFLTSASRSVPMAFIYTCPIIQSI